MIPTHGIQCYLPYCHGGRTEARTVGSVRESTHFDLTAAYPNAALLISDYSFLKSYVTTGSECEKRLQELLVDGPFQIVGVYL